MKTSPSNFYKKVLNRASIVLNLILFILISVNLSAQEGNKKSLVGTINPFGIDCIPKNVHINSTIKFKIKNVNTFKVNGNTVSTPLNIDFENPSVFTGLMSGFDKVSIVPNQTSEQINQSENNQLNELYNALTRNLNEKDKIYQNLLKINKTNDSTKMRLKSDSVLILNNKIDSLIKLINTLKSNKLKTDSASFIDNFKSFVETYQSIIAYTALENKLTEKIKDSVFIRDICTLRKNVKSDLNATYNQSESSSYKTQIINKINLLQKEFAEIQLIYDVMNKTTDKDSIAFSGNLKTSDEGAEMKISNGYIKPNRKKYFAEQMAFAKKATEIVISEKNQQEIIKKSQAGIDLYYLIINDSFAIWTPAEQLKDDEVTFTPKLSSPDGKTVYEFKPVTIKTHGGFKVNFSTGFFLNFIGDDNYDILKDSSGKNIGVVSTAKNKITQALGGMIHAYPRWIKGPQPALSAGISLAQNGNMGFYGGASVMFLEKNRLVVSTGYAFNKIKQLNTSNVNQNNLFITQSDTQIRYNDVYRGSWFIGITYNLTK
ncbi:MAG: hypothetical protein ACK5RI_10910 [Bacteroidota bacterium]|jgi:CRISPR/Cas system CSM-associated protein Csm2 small subunit